MRLEVSYVGVAKNRVYFVTEAKQGRPRKETAITKSKKPFATGGTRDEAINAYKDLVGFTPHNDQ